MLSFMLGVKALKAFKVSFLLLVLLTPAAEGHHNSTESKKQWLGHHRAEEVISKANITMAVMDGVGGVLNNLAQRLATDLEDVLKRLTQQGSAGGSDQLISEALPMLYDSPNASNVSRVEPDEEFGDLVYGSATPEWSQSSQESQEESQESQEESRQSQKSFVGLTP